jgi:hypothetical protein
VQNDTVVPSLSRSTQVFFDRRGFLALIHHYESVGWGFYGVDIFGTDRQLLSVEIAPEHGATWARSLAEDWIEDGMLFSPTLAAHHKRACW